MEKNISEMSKQQQQQHGQNSNDPSASSSSLVSPLGGRHTPRNFAAESNALRQLSDFTRPNAAYSPFSHGPLAAHHLSNPNISPLGLPPQPPPPNMPPGAQQLEYQMLAVAQYQQMLAKELEEKKQRELELSKSRSSSQSQQQSMPPTSAANAIYDQHQMEIQRRLSIQANAAAAAQQQQQQSSNASGGPNGPGGPPGQPQLNPYMMAAAISEQQAALERFHTAERLQALNDPILRMHFGLSPADLHGAGPGHPFSHPQGHPSLHPGAHGGASAVSNAAAVAAENAAAASLQMANALAGLPGPQFDQAALAALHPLSYPGRPQSIIPGVPRPDLAQASSLYRSQLEDHFSQV